MLKRIYIHNYKTFLNFELKLQEMNLFLGANGTGKSSVFEVLALLKDFLAERNPRTWEVFSPKQLCRFAKDLAPIQKFELDFEKKGTQYQYVLEMEYLLNDYICLVKSEKLIVDGNILISFKRKEKSREVELRDIKGLVSHHSFSGRSSCLGAFLSMDIAPNFSKFKEIVESINLLRLVPSSISSEIKNKTPYTVSLNLNGSNFIEWLSEMRFDKMKQTILLEKSLQQIFPNFQVIKIHSHPRGEKSLEVVFRIPDSRETIAYSLDELSDGQKALIILYSVLYYSDEGGLLCIDEPENFLALPEIQPWLDEVDIRAIEGTLQSMIISHHPQVIDFLSRETGLWFEQENDAFTRVKPIEREKGIPISELVQNGWIYEAE